MSLARRKIVFTYQDLENFQPDNYRHEISEGEHLMTPSPGTYHQRIVGRLYKYLSDYVEEKGLGELFIAPVDVVFHDIAVFVPDLVFVRKENSSIIGDENIQGAPDLIIEVMSPSSASRDKEMKYKRYAYYGVKEFWIVDSEKKRVEIYELDQKKLMDVIPHKQKLNSPMFPDLNVELAEIC